MAVGSSPEPKALRLQITKELYTRGGINQFRKKIKHGQRSLRLKFKRIFYNFGRN
jgi:hypothetical protein